MPRINRINNHRGAHAMTANTEFFVDEGRLLIRRRNDPAWVNPAFSSLSVYPTKEGVLTLDDVARMLNKAFEIGYGEAREDIRGLLGVEDRR